MSFISGRALVTVALVAAGAVAPPATAGPRAKPKPKPVCNLITDAVGDATYPVTPPMTQENLDIKSADVASNKKWVTVEIRLNGDSNNSLLVGRNYIVHFKTPGNTLPVFFGASSDNATRKLYGLAYKVGLYNTQSALAEDVRLRATVLGSYDENTHVIRISALVSELAAFAKATPGTPFTGLTALSRSWLIPTRGEQLGGQPGGQVTVDTATSNVTYAAAAPSCLKQPA